MERDDAEDRTNASRNLSRRTVLGATALLGTCVGYPGTTAAVTGSTTETTAAGAPAQWSSYQADAQNSGYLPDVSAPERGLAREWERDLGGLPTRPLTVGDHVVTGTETGSVTALDPKSGDTSWTVELDAPLSADPVAAGSTVVAVDEGKTIRAIGPGGKIQWRKEMPVGEVHDLVATGSLVVAVLATGDVLFLDPADGARKGRVSLSNLTPISESVIGPNTIYVSGEESLFAIDRESRKRRWSVSLDGYPSGGLAATNGVVCVGSFRSIVAFGADSGTEKWRATTPTGAITASDGVVYASSGSSPTLRALVAQSGDVQWSTEIGTTGLQTPAVEGNDLYAGDTSGNLFAVDATDGTERWKQSLEAPVRDTPAIGEAVYVADGAGLVSAADPAEGTILWSAETGGSSARQVTLSGGSVYLGTTDDEVHAVDAASGEQRWVFSAEGSVRAAPAVVDDTVYVATFQGVVHAIATADGSERWRRSFETIISDSLTVADGTVFVPLHGNPSIAALDAATGKTQWQTSYGKRYIGADATPAVSDGTVYFVQRGTLVSLRAADGKQRWTYDSGVEFGTNAPAPVPDGDTVYMVDAKNRLHAVEATDGSERWSVALGGFFGKYPPVPTGDLVLAANGAGALYGFSPADGSQQWAFKADAYAGSGLSVAGDLAYVSFEGTLHAVSVADGAEQWRSDVGTLVATPTPASGRLYYATETGRVVGGTEAKAPKAAFSYSPSKPKVGESVSFDASASSDPDGSIVEYRWDLDDDGSLGPLGKTQTYTYTEPGEHTVTLEVTGSQGLTTRVQKTLTVVEPTPTPTATKTETETGTETPTGTGTAQNEVTETSGPGFGVLTALAGLGGLAFRALTDGSEE